jgi:hypothetical protein
MVSEGDCAGADGLGTDDGELGGEGGGGGGGWKQLTKGGHFAALERPDVLLRDLVEFVEQVWKR